MSNGMVGSWSILLISSMLWGSPSAQAAQGAAKRGPSVSPAQTESRQAGIQWVRLTGGTFTLGADDLDPDAKPRHEVKIKPFQMAKTLVTNKQYKSCVAAGACKKTASYGPSFDGDDQPVVGVSWSQAKAFSKWAGGRLPSEAEWEYAARSGGLEQKYPWGDKAPTCETAVIAGCGSATAPVCSKPAGNTRQGLCDMAGNSWEWVEDFYHESYQGAPADGSAWKDDEGVSPVLRGGAWERSARDARSSIRYIERNLPLNTIGFRPAR